MIAADAIGRIIFQRRKPIVGELPSPAAIGGAQVTKRTSFDPPSLLRARRLSLVLSGAAFRAEPGLLQQMRQRDCDAPCAARNCRVISVIRPTERSLQPSARAHGRSCRDWRPQAFSARPLVKRRASCHVPALSVDATITEGHLFNNLAHARAPCVGSSRGHFCRPAAPGAYITQITHTRRQKPANVRALRCASTAMIKPCAAPGSALSASS
jgi:hypothetical protein